jgi:hypothetical protein
MNCCRFSFRNDVSTSCAVGQFDQSNDGDGYIRIPSLGRDCGKHLPRVLPLALGCYQYTGIED